MDILPKQHTIHLIARHAEATLWLARYMERIENLARILDVTNTFARDADDTRNWLSIPRINGDLTEFYKKHAQATQRSVGEFYLLDATNATSVQEFDSLGAGECPHAARADLDRNVAADQRVPWPDQGAGRGDDHARPLHLGLCHAEGRSAASHRHHRRHAVSRPGLALLHDRPLPGAGRPGHPPARHSVPLAGAADRRVEADLDAGAWNGLLRAAAGYHAYRREHPNGYRPMEVACFLLANTAFPRSVGLNLAQIEWHLTQLRTRYMLRRMSDALERLDHLNGAMTYQNVVALGSGRLSPFLDYVQGEVAALHKDIVDSFSA